MTAGPGTLARVALGALPTPLLPAPRLSGALGIEVWLKRDDLTGLGLGGNKVRALEYLLGTAIDEQATHLVTGGGPQSNWTALAALAAARCGLEADLVVYGPARPASGNLLLAELAGASVRFTGDPDRASVDRVAAALGDELRASGSRPLVLPRGGATPTGAVGYAVAAAELAGQASEAGLERPEVWLATGSCGTQAGLVAGLSRVDPAWKVIGVSVSRPVAECRQRVADLATGAADLLALPGPTASPDDVIVLDGHIGPGYGQPSAAGQAAAALAARTEGVLLDPVFAAKAMGALAEAAGAGRCRGPVIFLVTGGAPTLFAVR
jgi:D-cysteine desulfhydrase